MKLLGCSLVSALLRPPEAWPWQQPGPRALVGPIVDQHSPLAAWGSTTTTTTTAPEPVDDLGEASVDQAPPAPAPVELVELVPDYPQAVTPGSPVWAEMERHSTAAVAAINALRAAANLTAVRGWEARYGWTAAEAHAAFKICAHALVDGEPYFVTVDTAEAEGVTVQSVTPAEALLGLSSLAELSANLTAGETISEPPSDAQAFPCNADAAARMARHALGLLETRSALPGRRKRPAALLQDLPAAYDSRAAHPDCALPAVDQGSCGSCYAFAAAAMAGERICIATGQVAAPLSQQELVSCGSSTQAEYTTPWCMRDNAGGQMRKFTNGCHGATSFNALMYLHLFGLPTRSCVPYVSGGGGPGVTHFETGSGGRVPLCSTLETQACRVNRHSHRLSIPVPCPPGDVECIKSAIYAGGPVLAGFTVTDEFRRYPNDPEFIYNGSSCETPETPVGGHAVVLYGWGERDGLRYWLARNSWGPEWGVNGTFKIGFGVEGIEEKVLYSHADPDERSHLNGACIQVRAVGSQCVLSNACETEVRSVDVQYFGSERDCGSWTTTIAEFHPAAEQMVEGFYCTVTRDEFVRNVPDQKFYTDRTSSYPRYGCVLRNDYAGAGKALVCCGNTCMSSAPGSLAVFPDYACSEAACEERGGALYEKVED